MKSCQGMQVGSKEKTNPGPRKHALFHTALNAFLGTLMLSHKPFLEAYLVALQHLKISLECVPAMCTNGWVCLQPGAIILLSRTAGMIKACKHCIAPVTGSHCHGLVLHFSAISSISAAG
eukprot:1160629-Pelagomonas_calceolata.AAC.5